MFKYTQLTNLCYKGFLCTAVPGTVPGDTSHLKKGSTHTGSIVFPYIRLPFQKGAYTEMFVCFFLQHSHSFVQIDHKN